MATRTIEKIDFEQVPQVFAAMSNWANWSFGKSDENKAVYQIAIQCTTQVKRANIVDPSTWTTFENAKEFCGSDRGLAFFCTEDIEDSQAEDLWTLVQIPGVVIFTPQEALIEYHKNRVTFLRERLELRFNTQDAAGDDSPQEEEPKPLLPHILEHFATTPQLLLESLQKFKPPILDFMEMEAVSFLWQYSEPGYDIHAAAIEEYLHQLRISHKNRQKLGQLIREYAAKQIGTLRQQSERANDYEEEAPQSPDYQHPDILAKAGVTVLAGRPKMGKSYLALNLALAIAEGGVFASKFQMNYKGAVLYMALEDNRARMYSRMKAICSNERLPRSFFLVYEAPRLSTFFIQELAEWLDTYEDEHPRLVVIDVFNHIQTQRGSGQENIYDVEYRDMRQLSELATTYDLHILLVTHLNKAHNSALDARDAVMSSTAITGGASAIWILKYEGTDQVDATLSVSGKDIPMWDIALRQIQLDGHIDWEALGDNKHLGAKSTRTAILIGLWKWDGASPTVAELHNVVTPSYQRNSFYHLIKRMAKDGLIVVDKGKVVLTNQGASQASAEAAAMPHEEEEDF